MKFLLSKKTVYDKGFLYHNIPLDKGLQWLNVKHKPFRQI